MVQVDKMLVMTDYDIAVNAVVFFEINPEF
jgi:hypothetical protein